MKRLMILSAATLAVVQAHAADLPVRAAPVIAPSPVFSWTGFYVGAWGGYAFGDNKTFDLNRYNNPFNYVPPGNVVYKYHPDGGAGGGTIGYNYQFQNFVAGIEGTLGYVGFQGQQQFSPFVGVANRVGDSISKTNGGFLGMVTGRLGYAFDTLLVYAKGGYVYSDIRVSYVDPNPTGITLTTGTTRHVKDGWTIGGGVEYAFLPNMSVKAEYNYVDFGRKRHGALGSNGMSFEFEHKPSTNIVSVGVNYRFNLFQ